MVNNTPCHFQQDLLHNKLDRNNRTANLGDANLVKKIGIHTKYIKILPNTLKVLFKGGYSNYTYYFVNNHWIGQRIPNGLYFMLPASWEQLISDTSFMPILPPEIMNKSC